MIQLRKLLIAFLSSVFAAAFFGSVFGLILSFSIRLCRDSCGGDPDLSNCGERNIRGGFFGGDPFGNGFMSAFFIVADDVKYSSSLSMSTFCLSGSSFVMFFTMLGLHWASKRNAGDLLMLFCDVLLELLSCRWNCGCVFTGCGFSGTLTGSFLTSLKRNLVKSMQVAERLNFCCGSRFNLIGVISKASVISDELFNFSNLDFSNWTWFIATRSQMANKARTVILIVTSYK